MKTEEVLRKAQEMYRSKRFELDEGHENIIEKKYHRYEIGGEYFSDGSHKELITCPNCEHVQEAKVDHTSIWNIYVHDCDKCKYLIMESEWNPISKDRT